MNKKSICANVATQTQPRRIGSISLTLQLVHDCISRECEPPANVALLVFVNHSCQVKTMKQSVYLLNKKIKCQYNQICRKLNSHKTKNRAVLLAFEVCFYRTAMEKYLFKMYTKCNVFPVSVWTGIWSSSSPSWLNTRIWTRWLLETSLLSWDPTCCGCTTKGEAAETHT